jgi:uncharacterized protein YbjT (DUF2867 family)
MDGPMLVTGAAGAAAHNPAKARLLAGRGITTVALDYEDPVTSRHCRLPWRC